MSIGRENITEKKKSDQKIKAGFPEMMTPGSNLQKKDQEANEESR